MFTPTRDQARQFLAKAWEKRRTALPETPLETVAADIITAHPEYHHILEKEGGETRDFMPEDGQINPFLHLSLHLAIAEQLSIDQPPGLRRLFEQLCHTTGNRHDAEHGVLEALAETLYAAQRAGTPPDAHAYLTRVKSALEAKRRPSG